MKSFTLAIESSCDDTSVALVRADAYVKFQMQVSQDKRHAVFGGVVPEIASRAHTEALIPLIDQLLVTSQTSWEQIEFISVTNRPGLVGSLLSGVVAANTLGQVFNRPVVGVNHLEGHIAAPLLWDDKQDQPDSQPEYPWLVLAVSGGHTSLYLVTAPFEYQMLGTTRDDAAGEVFDKFSKMLGWGFPGGAILDQRAQKGLADPLLFQINQLPHFAYSFSGIKSAAERLIRSQSWSEEQLNNIAASYQEAIVASLLSQVKKASEQFEFKHFMVTGGVSANSSLRKQAQIWAQSVGKRVWMPPLRYCTDNAGMIGLVGWWHYLREISVSKTIVKASPHSYPEDFKIWS